MISESELRGDGDGIDGVEFRLFFSELAFGRARNKFFQTGSIKAGVEQKDSALLQLSCDIVLADVGFVVTSDEVG